MSIPWFSIYNKLDNDQDFSNNYIIIIIIIIILRHQLGLDRPVSASSNSLFKGLPSRLRPFGLSYFSIIFDILLLSILFASRNQFDLYLLSFSSAGSTFNSSSISTFICGQKGGTQLFFWKSPSWLMLIDFYPFFLTIQISFPYKRIGTSRARSSEVNSYTNHILTYPWFNLP